MKLIQLSRKVHLIEWDNVALLAFDYMRPTSLSEAFELLKGCDGDVRVLAGGTDMIVELRHGAMTTDHVIDIKKIPELNGDISVSSGSLVIPACVTMAELSRDARILRSYPALVEAANVVGSPQIRNRATLVGNLCNASPAADTVPMLALYGATVTILGANGQRVVRVQDFVRGNRDIDLSPLELVSDIRIPLPDQPVGSAFERSTRRRGVDLATVNVGCSVCADGRVSFALGAVSPRPLIVEDADSLLAGGDLDDPQLIGALDQLMSVATPITDVRASAAYRRAMLTVLGCRALRRARAQIEERSDL